MELTQFIIPAFVALEVALILLLYRYVLRDWIIAKWEEKMDEEGWLIFKLEPVIDEIEDSTKEPGIVVQEIQKGYMMKNRLLRPSLVGVTKKRREKAEKDEQKK